VEAALALPAGFDQCQEHRRRRGLHG
jgi:hypothetical protein